MSELEAVRRAVDRGEWNDALDLIAECGESATSAEGLELRARAEYGNGGFESSVSAWEELHTFLVDEGNVVEAARAAAMVALFLMMDTGLMAPVRGWLRRAERLLEGHDEVPAHALIVVVRGYERFMCGDMDAARINSASAIELGRRMGVDPAVVIGRVCAARVRIFDGHVQEGLDLLDEIAVDLMSGVARPADNRDDVLRADLCRTGYGASRPGKPMDRNHGAVASRRRYRWHQWSLSSAPGRDLAGLGTNGSG